MSLVGKNVVVTGGNSGIGLSTARAVVRRGGRVLITGRDATTLNAVVAELGDAARAVQGDIGDLEVIDRVVAEARGWLGHVDLLFVNAGVAKFAPFEEITEELYDHLFTVNTRGAFFTVQKFAPLLQPGASVVFNTSIADELGMPGASAYGATKAALRSMSRTLAAELVGRGVRVNAVSPGPITTPIYDRLGLDDASKQGLVDQWTAANPMKRFGAPEEVAEAVLFLGFRATYTTGSELAVDGGLTQL